MMTGWRYLFLVLGTSAALTGLLTVGMLLWGWPPALFVIVLMFGGPPIVSALDWLTNDKRSWRKAARVESRRRHTAGAH